ncbi:MAG TPA: hypothetical protein VH302_02610 [Bryobacteraceae bacterium]|nr:hypothetical protein [Bryobacteraceae bacterium]
MSNSNGRVFLLSPAKAGGPRYEMLVRSAARFDLAVKLREGVANIGEIYSFISGLYFRGKLTYTEAFPSAPENVPSALVIVPGAGLLLPETLVTIDQLKAISEIPVDEAIAAYREPLLEAAKLLDRHAGPDCAHILLGSIASAKYIGPLLDVFGRRLLFPSEFVGRGDMSRGGLMLRCARSGTELTYISVEGAVRHGSRPPKLPKWRKQ